MKLSKWICPWCDHYSLHYAEDSIGAGGVKRYGIKLACKNPGEFNCPDTTGICETEAEADSYAAELCGVREVVQTTPPAEGDV